MDSYNSFDRVSFKLKLCTNTEVYNQRYPGLAILSDIEDKEFLFDEQQLKCITTCLTKNEWLYKFDENKLLSIKYGITLSIQRDKIFDKKILEWIDSDYVIYAHCSSIINGIATSTSLDKSWNWNYEVKPQYSFVNLNKKENLIDGINKIIEKESYQRLEIYLKHIIHITSQLKQLFSKEKLSIFLYKIDILKDFISKGDNNQIINHFIKHFSNNNIEVKNSTDKETIKRKCELQLKTKNRPHDKSIELKTTNFLRYMTTFYLSDKAGSSKPRLPKQDIIDFSMDNFIEYLKLFENIKNNDIKYLNPIYVRDKKYYLKKRLKNLKLNNKILKILEKSVIQSKEIDKRTRKKLIEIGVLIPFDGTKDRQNKWKVTL